MIERLFKLKENNTNLRTELIAGLITFLTMSYILVVNPNILGATGMDKAALFTATAAASILGTMFMAIIANVPIAQAPGMGLNSFFAYSVVLTMGYSWQMALTAVFIEGIIFIILTFFNVRELIVKSIPQTIKDAIPVGIGLFIAFIGLQNSGLIVKNPNTMVAIGDLSNHHIWIAFVGLIVIAVLTSLKVHGAFLIGIIAATITGALLGEVKMPEGGLISTPPSIAPIFAKFEWSSIFTLDMAIVVFTFLFVNLFDTVGTLLGVAQKANLIDKDGNFPKVKKALFADALGTTAGAVLGTSTVTSYVESASGVASGGRTGLTSISTAIMFGIALFLAPLFLMVPASATAPALIMVGLFMISSVLNIHFDDITEALPAFLTIVMMPFAFSIAQGVVYGMLSFAILKLFTGRLKDVSTTVWVIAILFLLKMIMDAMHLV